MNALAKRLAVLTATLVAVWTLLPSAGSAQIPLPLPSESPTPSPSPTRSSSPKPTASPTTKPRTRTGTRRPKPASSPKRAKKRVDPEVAEGVAEWLARVRSPARTTTRLLELIERIDADITPPSAAEKRRAFGQFPVVGYVWYQDDYGAPRYVPYFHPHEGTDLFARSGTPVIAVADGMIVKLARGTTGGNGVWLSGDDGVRYYYGHLKRFARGLRAGQRVRLGQVIGTVGATGLSAEGTYPHVHFEVNPGGRGTINPKPVLDAWLDAAEGAAVQALGAVKTRRVLAPFGAARWDLLASILDEQTAPAPSLWQVALGGGGTTSAYADLLLAEVAGRAGDGVVPSGATGDLLDPLAGWHATTPAAGH